MIPCSPAEREALALGLQRNFDLKPELAQEIASNVSNEIYRRNAVREARFTRFNEMFRIPDASLVAGGPNA